MEELTPRNLRRAIDTLRALGQLRHEAEEITASTGRQLTSLAERLQAIDLGAYIPTIATLSRLRGFMVRTDRSLMDREAGSISKEDEVLRQLLPKDPITYVDIGAGPPVRHSNTWELYQRGGHGLLIEPRPFLWYALLATRPRDRLWPTAVGDFNGLGKLRLCDGASSVDPTWDIEEGVPEIVIEVRPVQAVLDAFPDIRDNCQFCTIDVEGFERRVLRAIDFAKFAPQVICVEYITFEPFDSTANNDHSQEWAHILTDNGYVEYTRTKQNVIYMRKPQDPPPAPAPEPEAKPQA